MPTVFHVGGRSHAEQDSCPLLCENITFSLLDLGPVFFWIACYTPSLCGRAPKFLVDESQGGPKFFGISCPPRNDLTFVFPLGSRPQLDCQLPYRDAGDKNQGFCVLFGFFSFLGGQGQVTETTLLFAFRSTAVPCGISAHNKYYMWKAQCLEL